MTEFGRFVHFLRVMWGEAAAVSMLFPLSNALVEILPLTRRPSGGFVYLVPALVTLIATLGSLSQVVWLFTQRDHLGIAGPNRARAGARRCFSLGVLALVTYLIGHHVLTSDVYFDVLGWHRADPRLMIGDIVLLFSYAIFFGSMTRAFTLLGLLEFARQPQIKP